MAQRRLMVVIAGHNGAGKTTFYRERLEGAIGHLLGDNINPDDIERSVAADFGQFAPSKAELERIAAREATRRRTQSLQDDVSFSFETGFSDRLLDKVRFMESARQRGYLVVLMAVGLESIQKSKERVAARFALGGHNIAPDKLEQRYGRVLHNFAHGARAASLAIFLDNSQDRIEGGGDTFWDIAFFENGAMACRDEVPPSWWLQIERIQAQQ